MTADKHEVVNVGPVLYASLYSLDAITAQAGQIRGDDSQGIFAIAEHQGSGG
jgi:hypothetical protein